MVEFVTGVYRKGGGAVFVWDLGFAIIRLGGWLVLWYSSGLRDGGVEGQDWVGEGEGWA